MFDVDGKFQDLIFILFSQVEVKLVRWQFDANPPPNRANDTKYSGWNWEQGI